MAQAAVRASSTDQLLAVAMALPEPERVELVRVLLASLSPLAQEDAPAEAHPEPELTAELQRRRQAYLAGELDAVSLEELEHDLVGVLAAVHR
jgi:putative addiction module component (TIGR02574 family)